MVGGFFLGKTAGVYLFELVSRHPRPLRRERGLELLRLFLSLGQDGVGGGIECEHGGLELVIGGAEGWHENEGVQDGAGEEAVISCFEADAGARSRIFMLDIDSGDEAALADGGDVGIVVFEMVEELGEEGDFWLEV